MKKLYILILCFTIIKSSKAQISVTATSGTTGPTAYTTLKGAFDAINAGTHQGTISIDVTGNTTETATASLNASGSGVASYTTVTVQPSGGAARTISSNIGGPVITLNGADHVTINGLNSGGNQLTIQNTSSNNTAIAILMDNDAQLNTVTNCTIKGGTQPTTSSNDLALSASTRGLITFGSTAPATGNTGNVISNSVIGPYGATLPWCLIFSYGNATNPNQNEVLNNVMYDSHYSFTGTSLNNRAAFIFISANNTAWSVSGNRIYQSASRSQNGNGTRNAGILFTSGDGHTISDNIIGGSASDNTGTMTYTGNGWSFYGIECYTLGTTNKTTISGNTVYHISYTSSNNGNYNSDRPRFAGINVQAGYYDIIGNTIGSVTENGSITFAQTDATYTTQLAFIWARFNGAKFDNISNNRIGGINISGNNLGGTNSPMTPVSGIMLYGAIVSNINGNIIGSTTVSNSIDISGVSATNTGFAGIYDYSSNASCPAISVSDNVISNIRVAITGTATSTSGFIHGISYSFRSAATVNNNTINNLSTSFGSTSGNGQAYGMVITQATANNFYVNNNKITGISSANAYVTGITMYVSQATTEPVMVTGNMVSGLSTVYSMTGISSSNSYDNVANLGTLFANNIVRLNFSPTGQYSLTGISLTGKHMAYYNTSYLTGTGPVNANNISRCFYLNTFNSNKPVVFKNNIAYNNRTATSATDNLNFGLEINSNYLLADITTDNNDFYAPNVRNAVVGYTVWPYSTGTKYTTLSSWQTASSKDAASISTDPQFINAAGFTAIDMIPSAAATQAGVTVADITTDYAGTPRGGTPTMGAWEYGTSVWVGSGSDDWNTGGNWLPATGVPSSGSTIYISPSAVNDLVMDQDRTVKHFYFNNAGRSLVLGNHTLTATSVSDGSSSSYVKTTGTGRLSVAIGNASSAIFPVGNTAYNPVTITNNTGSSSSFAVKILDEVYQNGSSAPVTNSPHIKRTWDISSTASGGTGVDFVFNWNADELSGSVTAPVLYHYNGTAWEMQTAGTTTYTSTSLTYTGYDGSFSPFAIGDNLIILPVQLTSFTATREDKNVLVRWETAGELNSKEFTVQHSTDGVAWNNAAVVTASGNNSTRQQYSFIHTTPSKGMNYYRLVQTDLDGKVSWSKVAVVQMDDYGKELSVFPNPSVNGLIFIRLDAPGLVHMYDLSGKLVWQQYMNAGIQQLAPGTALKGMYLVHTKDAVSKIVVQ